MTTTAHVAPRRMTPVDVLARDAYEAVVLLGPGPVCLDEIERIARSRPVLVRAAMDRLLDIGLVTATAEGCFALPTTGGAA